MQERFTLLIKQVQDKNRRALGRGLSEFRRATNELKVTLEREVAEDESASGASPTSVVSADPPAPQAQIAPAGGRQDGADHPA